jgi:hypothetical protein
MAGEPAAFCNLLSSKGITLAEETPERIHPQIRAFVVKVCGYDALL